MDIRVRIFQALSDETRLRIIVKLKNCQEASCSKLGEDFELSLPAPSSWLSYHFRTLREAGLIKVRRRGQFLFCSLNKKYVEKHLPGILQIIR